MKMQRNRAIIFLIISLIVSVISARYFLKMRKPEPIIPRQGLTSTKKLSDYFEKLKGTRGDTDVYFFDGDSSGGTTLILGGTHPNEPAGFIAAVVLIENLKTNYGRIIVIPRTNNSAFTHNDPQEANPQRFTIQKTEGERWFRFGSRSTNPIDQWPDPEVYRHYPSGQKLSGTETRNLNRSYPGRPDGSMTEKITYGIMELMRKENVDLAFDLHEASLEYPVINAIVAHPTGFDLAGEAVMYLQMEGLNFSLEPSPANFRGLSHREWGDHLNIPAILMESANTVQGRYHGRLTPEVVISGRDRIYEEAFAHNLLKVDYPKEGIPLKVRVGRHLAAFNIFLQIWNSYHPEKLIITEGIPSFDALQNKGIGAYLN